MFQKIVQIVRKKLFFLMTPSWEIHKERGAKSERRRKWHYLSVWILSAFLWEIASKNDSDFYCLNCLHFFWRKTTLELKERESENKEFRNLIMPFEHTNILEFNHDKNLMKHRFLFIQILNLYKKTLLDVKTISKICLHQK